jgi:EF hand
MRARLPILVPATLVVTATLCSGLTPALAQDAAGREAMAGVIFARLDANGDGQVTRDEAVAMKEKSFARADKNGDGRLDTEELDRAQARLAKVSEFAMTERVMRLDSDGDNALSLAEYTAATPFFTLIDADGNGAISQAEFDRARAAFAN